MANENRPNTNQSQFFITLAPCEWLNRKHTIFGKITGNTIFNVLKLGEIEVGANDRPVDIVRITSVEVLWNPFDDITPRATIAKAQVSHASEKKDSKKERKVSLEKYFLIVVRLLKT